MNTFTQLSAIITTRKNKKTMNTSTTQKQNFNWCCRFLCIVMLGLFSSVYSFGQVTVTGNTNVSPILSTTYTSLASAVTALNTVTTISGPVVITLTGNETAPSGGGGYSITTSPTGISATNNITIQGSGSTLTAAASPTVGQRFDAIIKIIGADFITIQNFTLVENPANTTGGAIGVQQMTEFGIGLFAASTTNGAQNNTIQNNTITLSSTTAYQNAIGIFSTSASSATNGAQAAASIAGTNSNNKIYGNIISGVAHGIYFLSPAQTATVFESGNDIGGTSASTGNTITFGVSNTAGDLGFTSYSGATSAGIYFRNVVGNSVRFNTINSTVTLSLPSAGIFSANGTAPTGVTYTTTFSDNIITITNNTNTITAIDFGSGLSTGTIISSNNNITINQTATASNAAAITGIKANYASATNTCNSNTVVINQTETTGALSSTTIGITLAGTSTTNTANSNTITINQTGSGTGTFTGTTSALSVAGAATTINALTNTILINQTTSVATGFTTGTISGILANAVATTVNVTTTNSITINQAVTGAGTYGTNPITYINVSAASGTINVTGNTLNTTGSTIRSTGNLIGVFQDATVTVLVNISSNTVNIDRVATTGSVIFQSTSGIPSEVKDVISNNNITFTNLAGTTSVTAISSLGGPSSPAVNNKTIDGNTINISGTYTGTAIGITEAFTNTGFIRNNSVTISGASPAVTGITTTGSAMTITGNSVALSSTTTSPTSMTGIADSGAGTTDFSSNTISSMNFSGVVTVGPIVFGISYTAGSTNTVSINNNIVTNISVGAAGSTGSPTIVGINAAGSIITMSKNRICSITTLENGASTIVSGIRVTGSSGTSTISNNRIGDLNASAAVTTDGIRGINITSTSATTTLNVYYNTIWINSATTATTFGSTGLFHTIAAAATTATLDLRYNIIVNTSANAGVTGLTVAYRRSGGVATNLLNYASTSDRNLFYAGTPGTNNLIYSDGAGSAQTLLAYKNGVFTAGTIAPRDANSISENPPFLSTSCGNANFLKINTTIATGIESGGITTAGGVTDDFEGDIRFANPSYVTCTTPTGTGTRTDIGADEFCGTPLPLCTGTPATSTINGAASVCTGSGTTLTLSTTYTDIGINYQWLSSTTSGGPYSTTLGTASSQATGNLTSDTYYVCTITCSNSGLSTTTIEKSVLVNPLPSVTINGTTSSTSSYCTPGGTAVTLTAAGAGGNNYSWSPVTGLSPTVGSLVVATPSANTTYVVTGTDGNGCVNTASATITVAAYPVNVTATSNPSTICPGATSNLTSTGNLVGTANQYIFSTGTGTTLDPMSGAVTVIGSPAVSSGTGDDSPSGVQSIGFNFNYEGTNYSQCSVSPDGWILLGGAVAASQFSNVTTSTTNIPKIYAYWDDLCTGTNGSVKTLVTGSAPNRIFITQWLVTIPRSVSGAANSTYQVWLYETSGKIEFRYGTMGTATGTVSSGLTGATATNFNSITFSTNTASNSSANDAQVPGATPVSGRIYTFNYPSASSFSWSPAASVVSPASQNTATNPLAATTIFTVTATNSGCGITATASVTIDPLTGQAATVSAPVCAGSTFTVTANKTGGGAPFTYAWTSDAPLSNSTTSSVIANLSAGTYAFSAYITDNCGNSAYSTLSVVVNALPPVTASPTTGAICNPGGSAVTITAGGAVSYTWAPADGLNQTTGSPVVANPASNTTYTVTGTDAIGCINKTTSVITVANTPTFISATATPSTICTGTTSTVTVNAIIPTPPISGYGLGSLTGQTYSTLSGAGISIINTIAGLTTGFGGVTQDDGGVLVNLPFNFSYCGNTFSQMSMSTNGWVGCGNQSTIDATNSRTNGNLFTSAIPNNTLAPWFKDMGANFPLGTGSLRHGLIGTDVYAFQWDKAVGSSFSDNSAILISFQVNIYGPSSISPGRIDFIYGPTVGSIALIAAIGIENATGGTNNYLNAITGNGTTTTLSSAWPGNGNGYSFTPNSAPLTYSWAPSAQVVNSTSQTTATTALTATTTYTVTVSNSGCLATSTTTVTVDPLTGLAATISSPVCAGSTFTVTANKTGGGAPFTYAWTSDAPLSSSTTSTVTANLSAGTYAFSAYITDNCGNSAYSTLSVVVNALPPVTASPSTGIICNPGGLPVDITAGGAVSYTWSPVTGLTPTLGSIVSANAASTTTYTVTGTDGNGCSATTTSLIKVGSAVIINSVTAAPNTICSGGNSVLTAAASYSFTSYCEASVSIGACTSPDEFISNLNFSTISNSSSCDYTTVPRGYTDYTSISTPIVGGTTYTLTVTNGGPFGGDQCKAWIDFNQNGSFTDVGEEFVLTNPALDNITWKASILIPTTALNGITRMRARVTYTGANTPCGILPYGETEDYTVVISGATDGFTYTWSPSSSLTNTTSNPANATGVTSTTTYTVVASSAIGCTASSTVLLTANNPDDSNPCTDDACDTSNGSVTHTPLASIDDGNACTDDYCDTSNGSVTHTALTTIDDGNPCTDDYCDTSNGSITHTALATIDDGNACTDDACDTSNGSVTHTALTTIDDSNPCTDDACDTSSGSVTHTPLASIDDGNACTDDACDTSNGSVTHTALTTINDGNVCTTDACDTFTGSVTHTPLASISDGNACTDDFCNSITGSVTHTPLTTINDGNACTTDACDTSTGSVTHTPVTGTTAVIAGWIFDGTNALVVNTVTASTSPSIIGGSALADIGVQTAGSAVSGFHTNALTLWSTPAGNASAKSLSATRWGSGDYWQFQVKTTSYSNIIVSFDQTGSNTGPRDFKLQYGTDGINFTDFTTYTVLANGGAPNPTWSATAGSSAYTFTYNLSAVTALNNATAVYFRLTNTSAIAINGGAVGTAGTDRVDNFTVKGSQSLDDGNPCTTDECNTSTGVFTHTPLATINDGNACTNDACDTSTGSVTHTTLTTIDDGNACTDDACDTSTGSVTHTPLTTINDGDACTDDACDTSTGSVTHTALTTINDGNACTDDACDTSTGSVTHTALTTINDGDACTDDACDTSTGSVTHTALTTIEDGNACTDDACDTSTGSVTHTPLTTITDGNACTDDVCDSSNGSITHTPLAGIDDGDPCTADACNTLTGSITHTPLASIDDGDVCTTDGCDSNGSVTHTPALKVTCSGTDVNCYGANNGTTSVTPNGGTGPYTYSWTTTVYTAASTTIAASKDNSIYEENQTNSNALGPYLPVGNDDLGSPHRSLMAFDIASNVPSGSVITGASLSLYLTATAPIAGIQPIDLHKLLADWGEGTSFAILPGQGGPATPGDATWRDNFYLSSSWANMGGDFLAASSAVSMVGGTNSYYIWSSAGMVSDVQGWLNTSGTNYGWLIKGAESGIYQAKRFNSREYSNPSQAPALTINYNVPSQVVVGTSSSLNNLAPGTYCVTVTDDNGCTSTCCHTVLEAPPTDDGNPCTDDFCNTSTGSVTHTPIAAINDGNACTDDACDTSTGSVTHTTLTTINDGNACTDDACNSSTGSITHTPLTTINDGNACTNDACDSSTGSVTHTPLTTINDGNACTTDACNTATGSVTHTTLTTINDGNACTTDACDSSTGSITHTPLTTINDNNFCTDDACNTTNGVVTHTPIAAINDGNVCTDDACDSSTGSITHTPASSTSTVIAGWIFDGVSLSASSLNSPSVTGGSTTADNGSQTAGSAFSGFHTNISVWSTPAGNASAKSLSANNWQVGDYFQFVVNTTSYSNLIVTFDQTGSNTGPREFKLQYGTDGINFTDFTTYSVLANGGAPNPSWSVTVGSSAYTFTFNLSAVTVLNNVPAAYFRLRDNSTVAINSVNPVATAGTSRVDNFAVKVTQSVDDGNPCTTDACNSSTGAVTHTPLATINDGNACTDDACDTSNGSVTHTALTTINDGNACTDDACDSSNGSITHTPVSIDDSNACTDDACDTSTGSVTHTPLTTINDGNACTDDACDSTNGSITHTPLTTINDNNACTNDACDSSTGSITHTAIAGINDDNACTNDACDSSTGSITHTAIAGINDDNACTNDACDSTNGSITHTALTSINDGNACTDDACDSSNGSVTHTPLTSINDGNACTDDACDTANGSVTHTALSTINDDDACTVDACNSATGSVTHTALAGIDDRNACTDDACNISNGSITHTPLPSINDGNSCTDDACNTLTGSITHTALTTIDDANACTDDACDSASGSVTHTALATIDDGNACTDDACDSTNGSVTHTALTTIDDGNACTDDACDSSNGSITHTPLSAIDDRDACTNDACNSSNGSITHTPLTTINDGNACTNDVCNSFTGLVTHTPVPINDNNACTSDVCNSINGSITHTPIIIDDKNACTTDACNSITGSITYTPLTIINDDNACTDDACDSSNGSITHTPIAGINDNNACTDDACDSTNGSVTHTALATIDDGNACTDDACDSANGSITHTAVNINDSNACTDDACDSATGSITHTSNPVVPTATAGAILCNGGNSSVTVTATGGQGSYTGTNVSDYLAGTYTISVTDARGCTGTTSITITEPDKLTVTVNPVVCSGNFGSATAVPAGGTGAYTYLWGPATLTSQTTNPATNLVNGVYTVRVTDANACSATSSAFTVTCTVGCPVVGPITGPLYVCKGQTVSYCVPAVSGGYTYVWTLPAGMTAVGPANGNCITVSVGTHLGSSGGYICVKSSCVGSNQVCLQVKKAKNPNTPGTISGPSTLCPGTCATYSVAAVQYADSYVWSASAGLTITSYQGTNSVLVCASASYTGGGSVSVKARNCKKDSGIRTKSNIQGGGSISWHASQNNENATVACAGSTVAYEVTSPGTGGCVTFSAPAGAVIRDRRGNASNPLTITQPDPNEGEWEVDVQFPAGFVSGNVTATPCGGPCGPGTPITIAVRSTPAAPTVITGNGSVCKHSTVCYSIPAAAGATSYTWSITPTNTGIQVYSGQGTTNVCIKYNNSNTASATLNVKANNSCGSSATTSKPITINLGCKVSPDASGIDAGLTGVLSSLNAYPNPTTGKAAVTFNSDRAAKYTLKVVDMIGKVMISESISAVEGYNMKEINLENVAKGLYLISVQTEGSEAQTLRLVVE